MNIEEILNAVANLCEDQNIEFYCVLRKKPNGNYLVGLPRGTSAEKFLNICTEASSCIPESKLT